MDIGEHYPPRTLVFLDESATNRFTSQRTYAWAPIGDRARRHDFFVRGTRYSILPAISLDGVLHLDILTRSWTGIEFRQYLDILLDNMNPYPQNNSVLIMDNASVHHFDGVREMVEARCVSLSYIPLHIISYYSRGIRLVYLPPYSPDFDPIEEGFSSMKMWIRANRDYVLGELSNEPLCDPVAMLFEAVFTTMTPANIEGWFRDSGYIV
jgi:transposase